MSSSPVEPHGEYAQGAFVAARVEELYRTHLRQVRRICRGLLRDRVEAEDAVQQTFLSAHRALANGSVPREEAAWIATIARHECLARVQARMREPLPVDEEIQDLAPDVHATALHRHEAAELREALAALPAQQRDAFLLRELRGLSYDETAIALAVTTSAVESLLFRARRNLQVRLREALAALSPGEWTGALRELLAKLAGGSLAAPAAAKIAAVGLGAAVVTGGAISSPDLIGLGHAPRVAATRTAAHAPARAVKAERPQPKDTSAIWVARNVHPKLREVSSISRARHDSSSSRDAAAAATPEISDTQQAASGNDGSSGGETESGSSSTTTSTSSSESGDGGGSQTTTTTTTTTQSGSQQPETGDGGTQSGTGSEPGDSGGSDGSGSGSGSGGGDGGTTTTADN